VRVSQIAGVYRIPVVGPVRAQRLLVEVACDHDTCRHHVQHTVYADAHHEALQLVNTRAVVLHHSSNAAQRHKPGEKEASANSEINAQWHKNEHSKPEDVTPASHAHSSQRVTVNLAKREQHDGFDCRDCPRNQVEIVCIALNRLVAPLHAGRKEPGDRQNYPPQPARHAEEVQHHEDNCAAFALRTLGDYKPRRDRVQLCDLIVGSSRRKRIGTCDLIADRKAHNVRNSNNAVAARYENDRPLRVAKTRHVHQKCGDCEQRRSEADHRCYADHISSKLTVIFSKEGVVTDVAWHSTVTNLSLPDEYAIVQARRDTERFWALEVYWLHWLINCTYSNNIQQK